MLKFCLKAFIISRSFYILFTICVNWLFLNRYDESNDLLLPSTEGLHSGSSLSITESFLNSILRNFISYDGGLFLQIAMRGYSNVKSFCFFPVFPFLIHFMSFGLITITNIVNNLIPAFLRINNNVTIYALSGFLITNILCFINTILLHSLCQYLRFSQRKTRLVIILFLINPGTIFFIAIYSENLYLTLHLLLILMLFANKTIFENKISKMVSFIVFIAIVIATRSNSLFLVVYLAIPIMVKILEYRLDSDDRHLDIRPLVKLLTAFGHNSTLIVKIIFLAIFSIFCFFLFTNFHARAIVCSTLSSASHNKLQLSMLKENSTEALSYQDEITEYTLLCESGANFYTYLQKRYWGVSLLSQYSFDTLDRVLLSLPVNIIAVCLIFNYIKLFNWQVLLRNGDLFSFLRPEEELNTNHHNHSGNIIISQKLIEKSNLRIFNFCSFINFSANFLVVALIAHPQINNRVMSCSPLLYFYAADQIIAFGEGKGKFGYSIIVSFFTMSILSCVMQSLIYGFA